jgi:hypothetical protein
MKRLFTCLLIAVTCNAFAQKEKRVTPVYFISGELTSPDSFNRFLAKALPDVHIAPVDSSVSGKWTYKYSGNNHTVTICYYIEAPDRNSVARVSQKRSISHVELKGDLAMLVNLYNKIFNTAFTALQMEGELPIRGPVWYGYNDYVWNKSSYWFSFADFKPDGYVMMFRKVNRF